VERPIKANAERPTPEWRKMVIPMNSGHFGRHDKIWRTSDPPKDGFAVANL